MAIPRIKSGDSVGEDYFNAIRDELIALDDDVQEIASTQRGTITLSSGSTTADGTLTPAVVEAKSRLRLLGHTIGGGTPGARSNQVRIHLQSTTAVRATRQASGTDVVVSYELTEYE